MSSSCRNAWSKVGTGIPTYQNYQTTKLPNYQATKLPNYADARSKPAKSFTDFEVCFLLKRLGAERIVSY